MEKVIICSLPFCHLMFYEIQINPDQFNAQIDHGEF